MSEDPQGRPSLPSDSRPAPIPREDDQPSGRAHGRHRCPTVSTSSHWRLGQYSVGPQCLTAVLGASRSCLRPRSFDKLSRVTRDGVRGPMGLTRCSGLLGLVSEDHGVHLLSWATRASV